jgi:hypothetical protein
MAARARILRAVLARRDILAEGSRKETPMTIRLIALCLCLLPSATLAQQSTYPGSCDHAKACPEGQTMDSTSKTCVDVSA